MKLERFKERNNKMIGVVLFTIICILLIGSVILYKTFASFEVNHNFNIINGTVQEMGDLEFAFYVDNGIVKEAPSEREKENYVFDEENSSCTNGASVYWDYERWGPDVSNITNTKTKCYLKFKKEYSEPILNGAVPEIEGDLTPVTIDEKGTVRKADVTSKWYSYESQQWANAVITKNSYELLGSSNIYGEAKLEDGYVHLDGVDDYIDLGLANYDFSEGITLVMNAKLYDKDGAHFGNWEGGGGGLGIEKTGEISFKEYINGGYKIVKISHDGFDFDNYHVIIGTYNNEKLQLIIDGEVKATTSNLTGTIKQASLGIILGGNPNKNGLPPSDISQMDIKQAAIFNRAITEEEFRGLSTDNFKITNDEGLLKYVDFTNKKYEANEVISEDNIESYFVWIPRYRYELWNGEEETSKFTDILKDLGPITNVSDPSEINQAKEIKIEFENKHTTINEGTKKNQYLTHPAFISFNSNGMWVGKFETGYKGATATSEAEVNVKEPTKVIIKPDVYSWRGIQVANAFSTSKKYQENLNSHMMKNTEWGAVAYLTNSKYGRCPNGSCEEVRINNSANYVTGSSAVNPPTCGYTGSNESCNRYDTNTLGQDTTNVNNYNNPKSVVSSTTNNYTGIYDMSGGSWEYVMGVMLDNEGKLVSGRNDKYNSNFVGTLTYPNTTDGVDSTKTTWTETDEGVAWPDKKYYDTYDYATTDQAFNRGLFGDATKELGPFYQLKYINTTRRVSEWNADAAYFVDSGLPWFGRGGDFTLGTDTGVFAFKRDAGHEKGADSFRIVLTP